MGAGERARSRLGRHLLRVPDRSLLRRCLRPVPAAADHEAAGTQIRAADRYLPASGSELEALRGPQEGPGAPVPAARAESWGAVVSRGFLCTPSPRGRTPGARSDSPAGRASKLVPERELRAVASCQSQSGQVPPKPESPGVPRGEVSCPCPEWRLEGLGSGDPNRGIPSVGVSRWVAEQTPLLHFPHTHTIGRGKRIGVKWSLAGLSLCCAPSGSGGSRPEKEIRERRYWIFCL